MASPSITAGSFPAWPTVKHLTLYHGCVDGAAKKIRAGVGVRVGSPTVDFGNGFYTTTIWDQAVEWARKVHRKKYPRRKYPTGNPADPPAVVKFVVPLLDLAALNSLMFVRGDATDTTFWSLIHHCRGGHSHAHPDPLRVPPDDWYDMVVGPVASWPPKPTRPLYALGFWDGSNWQAYDQFSFHTPAAVAVLNKLNRANTAEFETTTCTP